MFRFVFTVQSIGISLDILLFLHGLQQDGADKGQAVLAAYFRKETVKNILSNVEIHGLSPKDGYPQASMTSLEKKGVHNWQSQSIR